jgi:hypothetical protein
LVLGERPHADEQLTQAYAGAGLSDEGVFELLLRDKALRDQEGAEIAPSWCCRLPARS